MRDWKPTAPPRTLRPAHQVRPGGRWALPSGKQQQPNNIDMVVTGLYLHSSTLVDTIMFAENILLALAGKVLLEKKHYINKMIKMDKWMPFWHHLAEGFIALA